MLDVAGHDATERACVRASLGLLHRQPREQARAEWSLARSRTRLAALRDRQATLQRRLDRRTQT